MICSLIAVSALMGSELKTEEIRKKRTGFATAEAGPDGSEARFGRYLHYDLAVAGGFRSDTSYSQRAFEALIRGRKYFGNSFFAEAGIGYGAERDISRRFSVFDLVIGNEWEVAEHVVWGANWLGLSTRSPFEAEGAMFKARLPSMSFGLAI